MQRLFLPCLLAALAIFVVDHSEGAGYARPELLVEATALHERLDSGEPRLVVLHAGGESALTGSVKVNVGEWKAAFEKTRDPQDWGRRIGSVGVGPDSRVVVYDNGDVKNAARVWWILRYWGAEHVELLNGGLKAWNDAGYDTVDAATLPAPSTAEFEAVAQPERLRTTEQMIALATTGGERILDVRSDQEVESLGTIGEGTQHCEWLRLVDPRTRRFKPADELAKLLDLGSPDDEPLPVVTYCRSGGRASVSAFALELMGVEDVANYHGSWNAWSHRGGADE